MAECLPVPPAYPGALEFLLARIDYERTEVMPYRMGGMRLDRMRELLARLGNPDQGLKIVHVGGTKGKGSTAAMTAAILTSAGYRTGLFTSPHLDRLEERFVIDGAACSPQQIVDLVDRLRPVVIDMDVSAAAEGGAGPTYFELTTAMALLHFAGAGADFVVLEVGMGGRLDSTNVCQPLVSVITSISLDHTKQLGSTVRAIAGEKAGIIKPGVPVVSGVLAPEAREVIARTSDEHSSPLMQAERDFGYAYRPPLAVDRLAVQGEMDFWRRDDQKLGLSGLKLNLLGRHQAANAAVAIATVQQLADQGWAIPETAIRDGLANVRWPARVEVVGRKPTVIVDAAHNVASIESLLQTLDESFGARRRLLIFATTLEKDVAGMLQRLLPRFDHVIFTRYGANPRGVPVDELMQLADSLGANNVQAAGSVAAAWQAAGELAQPDDLICATGSFFLAAEVRSLLPGHVSTVQSAVAV